MASFASTTADSVPTGNEIDYKKAHFDRLSEKIKEVGALGSALIVGIQTADCEEDDEDEEDEEDDTKMYTKEQIESLRHIIVNKKRDAAFKVANRMVTGGQGDFCMFNTQSGNDLILNIIRYTKSSKAKKTLPEQYDSLLALTMQIDQYDFWMNDNEFWEPGDEMEKSMVGLGKAWSDLLAHSDAELGIDTEYTRPGTEALLDRFAESVNGVLSERGCKLFKWDGFKTPTGSSAGKKRPAAEVTAQCIFG